MTKLKKPRTLRQRKLDTIDGEFTPSPELPVMLSAEVRKWLAGSDDDYAPAGWAHANVSLHLCVTSDGTVTGTLGQAPNGVVENCQTPFLDVTTYSDS